MLELAAEILGPLVDEVVFVGGATVHLWIKEEAAPPVRATDDVDVICDVTTYSEYLALAEEVAGFLVRQRAAEVIEIVEPSDGGGSRCGGRVRAPCGASS